MVYNVLREYKAGSTILIHCAAGRQRSAALTAMFLLVTSAKPADYVMRYIKMQRPVAFSPAANFDRAIREFEARLQAAAVTVAAKKGS
jgi:protein-tyrosine phosphatase